MNKNSLLLSILILAVALAALYYKKTHNPNNVDSQEQHQNWEEWSDKPADKPAEKPQSQTPPAKPADPPAKIDSYSAALSAAKATNKPLLVVFGADWCHWCKELHNKTLADPSVQKELQKFVVYECNTDREKAVAQKFNVQSLPTCMIINANETVALTGNGYKSPTDFIRWLNSGRTSMMPPFSRLFSSN